MYKVLLLETQFVANVWIVLGRSQNENLWVS
jgi:hypothetical protein